MLHGVIDEASTDAALRAASVEAQDLWGPLAVEAWRVRVDLCTLLEQAEVDARCGITIRADRQAIIDDLRGALALVTRAADRAREAYHGRPAAAARR